MAKTYTVVSGDTLNKIAAANGLTLSELLDFNPDIDNPDLIHPGDVINLGSGTSGTSDDKTVTGGQTLNNIGGTPEVWQVGKSWFVVYTVPGTEDDPVYIAWEVPSKDDLQSFFGPDQPFKFNQILTQNAFDKMGVLEFGTTDELPNTSKDPFSTWATDMEMLAQTQPWVLDADYQALVAMSILEGRELTQAELATTDWWQTHTSAERDWMITLHGDPATAAQQVTDAKILVKELMTAAGLGSDPPKGLVELMAMKWLSGAWTKTKLDNQIKAVSDPFSGIRIGDTVQAWLDNHEIGQTVNEEDRVRELLSTWLGPLFGTWDDSEIARIAGTFRNDPEAEERFIETLKDQRMAILPQYTDRELSYAAISNTWRQWWMGQWGEAPDETSDLWMAVLKNNDSAASGTLLRGEGLSAGKTKVLQDFSKQTVNVGTSERNPIG